MRKFAMLFVFLILVFIFALPAFAQEATPEPQPVAEVGPEDVIPGDEGNVAEEVDVHEAAEILIRAVSSIIVGLMSAPIVTFVVSLVKRIPALKDMPAPNISFFVAGLLWVATALAGHFGVQGDLQNVIDLITAIGPPIVAFITTMVGAHGTFELARKAHVPVVGHQRTSYNVMQ